MSAEDQASAGRYFIYGLHETNAALEKIRDHMVVVDDLVKDIERCSVAAQSSLDALDGHLDARAEAARLGQQDFLNRHDYGGSLEESRLRVNSNGKRAAVLQVDLSIEQLQNFSRRNHGAV